MFDFLIMLLSLKINNSQKLINTSTTQEIVIIKSLIKQSADPCWGLVRTAKFIDNLGLK